MNVQHGKAYCQLIQLQQVLSQGVHEVSCASGSRLKSRVYTVKKEVKVYLWNNPSEIIPGIQDNTLHNHLDCLGLMICTGKPTPARKEFGDSEAPKKAPIGRLFNLNKPEAPILLLAVIAAFVHGLLFPLFSIMMSGGIRTFYYPAHQLRKDSRFWALLCLLLAIISLIAIQLEFCLFGLAGGNLVERVRALSFQSIMQQEVAWFDDPSNSRFVTYFFTLQLYLYL